MTALSTRHSLLAGLMLVLAGAALAAPAHAGQAAHTLAVVDHVDLERYTGTWYEIANIPNRFQSHCRSNAMAQYSRMENGQLRVVNSCVDKHGDTDSASGIARLTDSRSNAKLEVSFVSLFGWQLFWGDYWIFGLAEDYSYALVGHPEHRYAWILSRTPTLPAATRDRINQQLQQAGYSPADLVDTPQLGH